MSMNKTWPISNFKSDADSVGMEQLLLNYVTFYRLTSRNPGFDLITDVLPLGRLWNGNPDAISQCNRLRLG